MNHTDHKKVIDAYDLIQASNPRLVAPKIQPQASYPGNYGHQLGYDTRQSGGKSRYGLSRYQSPLILDTHALRQNARKASHDSIQARVILKRENDSVVGNGLKLDPTPKFEILGITREEAEIWADDVKERFDLWAKSKDSDLTGRNNFYQNTRFYGWQYGRDGDVFPRLSYSDDADILNPLQISFIDPNQIRGDEFIFSSGPEVQEDGIIKDKNGKETGYKVWITDPKQPGRFKDVTIPAFDEKTGRPIMLHGFDPEWAGQTRGIPELGHALQEFEDITSFKTATIKKAIIGAAMTLAVENEQQDPTAMGMEGMINAAAGPTEITTEAPALAPQNLGPERVTSCNLPEQTVTETGIMVLGGGQGDKIKGIPSLSPPEHAGEFIDAEFKYLAASKSMPKSIALMEFSKSHSASRGELGLYENVREIKKDDIASDFLNPVFGTWLAIEIGEGRVKAPGFSDPILKAAWLSASWRMKPLPDVDPFKTAQTRKLNLDLCLTDFDAEAIAANGSSGKANRAKVGRQLEEMPTDPLGLKKLEAEQQRAEQQQAEQQQQADNEETDEEEEE